MDSGQDCGYDQHDPFAGAPTLELDVANVAICLGNFYQGLLGCDLLCGHNEALGAATSLCLGRTNQVPLAGHRRR